MAFSKLFVSFSSQDIDYAEAFVEALKQEVGHDAVFFSPQTIGAGDQYFDRIMQYLNDCDAVILLASASSVGCSERNVPRSKHVTRELKESDDLNLPIYPVDIDGVLKRGTCDAGTRYIIGSYQYLDGERAPGTSSFCHVIEPLISALTHEQAQSQRPVEERLRGALQDGRIADAAAIARPLNIASLPGDAAVLAIIATLRSRDSLDSLRLQDAEQIAQDIRGALDKGCSADMQALGLYAAGVMCKEYFQKRVVQCPLGSYPHLKELAQQLPRLNVANKKLVRGLSKDFRAFEADWFFGGIR
ncbi:toll/interleukin-1 receptor domain-containing protein [Aliidiomarina sp. Khilg15.8]